jgi:hypothetical protein
MLRQDFAEFSLIEARRIFYVGQFKTYFYGTQHYHNGEDFIDSRIRRRHVYRKAV